MNFSHLLRSKFWKVMDDLDAIEDPKQMEDELKDELLR